MDFQLLSSSQAGRRMNHSTDSADLPISINSSRWHLPYPIVLIIRLFQPFADEGTMDGKEVIKVHCVDDGGDDRKDKVEEDGTLWMAAGACMHQRRKGTRKCLLPGKTNGQD
ncbi:hypothetical protein HPP92_001824 [Vanilla planifolia]|uniref:Uncharacterized protein n=1 Tax=Vanilla planifolia TaxID=51239 RepID=A0A835S469_VANPL|nr:hypothetical protein HPP92_001824 [Vanilla planifolia]